MEKKTPTYSMKSIPIPTRKYYEKKLTAQVEHFLRRIRWKVFVAKNPDAVNDYQTFGFNTLNSPLADRDLAKFEEEFLSMISNIKYRRVRNEFQEMLKEINEIKTSDKIVVFADKTKNQYKERVEVYKKRLFDSITTDYQKCKPEEVKSVYSNSAKIARSFKTGEKYTLADRIDRSTQNESFITYKDHKESFPGRVKTRLINPSKNHIGHISKAILDKINQEVMKQTGLNLWRSSKDVVSWF